MSTFAFAKLLLAAIALRAIRFLATCIQVDTDSVADTKSRPVDV
jgi:hypothetical protein